MNKWIKRILITGVVLALLLVGSGLTIHMLGKGTPDWYPKKMLSPQEMEQAAQSMQTKFIGFQDWAAGVNAEERTHASGRAPVGTDPTTASSKTRSISLTDAELNAFFSRWDDKVEDKYNRYVTDPVLVLQDDRIILAGTVQEMGGRIVSVHLKPMLDEKGKLHLAIDKVMGGNFTIPRAFYDSYRTKLGNVLTSKINRERNNAKLNADGSANLPLITATMNELLLHAINGEAAEPILFLPHDATNPKNGLPVRLTDLKVKGKTISFTVTPLTSDERKELLRRVREPAAAQPPAVTAAR